MHIPTQFKKATQLTASVIATYFLAIFPLSAQAVWGYSVAAKLAMYDALKETCRPLVPSLFEEVKGRLITLSVEERAKAAQARESPEYFEVLDETRKSMFNPQDRDRPEQTKECTGILTPYLPVPE